MHLNSKQNEKAIMAYKIITAATTEPITLEEARSHLRIDVYGDPAVHPDDSYIEQLISVSREWCEQYTGRSFAEQVIETAMDSFPAGDITLPLTPVGSITSVKYLDATSSEITLSSAYYQLDDYSIPNKLALKLNQTWPSTDGSVNNVKIRTVVGDSAIPYPVKAAMLLIIGNLYENRQEDQLATSRASFNSLPMGVYNLLQPYRLSMGV